MQDNTARNAEIVRLRRAGRWPTEIAREMRLSRNVVMGVLNRADMCDPGVDRSAVMLRFSDPRRKITPDAVRDILRRLAKGEAGISIASRFGVSGQTITSIKLGDTHKTNRRPDEEPGAFPDRTSDHVVSHTIAPTGADCAASKLNQTEDTAGATGARLTGGAL